MIPLYRRLLGDRFETLPPQVRSLHDLVGPSTWSGRADVVRGTSFASRLIAGLFRLPPDGLDQPIAVTFEPRGDGERWVRAFGRRTFPSIQRAVDGELVETVGPVSLTMTLVCRDEALSLHVRRARALGLPLPRTLTPVIRTRETELDGRYHFEVEAVMPLFGRLIVYRGWLVPSAR